MICLSTGNRHQSDIRTPATPDLQSIWDKYEEYKEPQTELTTQLLNFKRVRGHLSKLPTLELTKADAIATRQFLISNNSLQTAKRILMFLNSACEWALDAGIIEFNPYKGLAAKIKLKGKRDIDPFSTAEKDTINKAFEDHPVYNHYARFVKFLFMTGCRSSEAVGLRTHSINPDLTTIRFSEALVNASNHKCRKSTKTHKSRNFPINPRLRELLQETTPIADIVFPSITGQEINLHTFNALCWHGTTIRGKFKPGIVLELAEKGHICRYRPQYNTRHTAITHWLEAGIPVHQVAAWVGNSPSVIYQHYCGLVKNLVPPEY